MLIRNLWECAIHAAPSRASCLCLRQVCWGCKLQEHRHFQLAISEQLGNPDWKAR